MTPHDDFIEREIRKYLDLAKDQKERERFVKKLKSTYRDRIDHINRILSEYEK
jgi:hypothetical protein